MILTVTPNPALDLTYHVGEFVRGGTHRPHAVRERAGGKGVNVARVLASLGETVIATGPAGGVTGRAITGLLERDGVTARFTTIGGETRRTVLIADRDSATGVWEPGPVVTAAEWAAFTAAYIDLLSGVRSVVLSGSLPPGVPADGYAPLVAAAVTRGIPVILDADGPALHHGLAAGPTLVKPNSGELAAATGTAVATPADALAAAHRLRAGRGTAVVASLGPDGLVAATADRDYLVAAPVHVDGNPTGAGDAAVAALARGLATGSAWPDMLADAVAISGGAVASPVAGESDAAVAARVRRAVTVRTIERN